MTQTEALRLALEALEDLGMKHYENTGEVLYKETFTAIKAALEAKDEPVVWNEGVPAMLPKQKEGETFIVSYEPKLEAKDEPVAWISPTELLVMRGNALGGAKDWRVNVGLKPEDGDVGLYTAPPQRTWVGLTVEEKQEWIDAMPNPPQPRHFMVLVNAIESELKEKNT